MTGTHQRTVFRQAVLDARSNRGAGGIMLAQPLPMRLLAYACVSLLLCITLLLSFGHYTRRARVSGQVVPVAGSISVVSGQFGRILARHVTEGDEVTAGQVLFVLTAERTGEDGNIDTLIESSLSRKREAIASRGQAQLRELNRRQKALVARRRSLELEITSRREGAALLNAQISAGREKLQRYETLADDGFVSSAALADLRSELAGQSAHLKDIETGILVTERDLAQARDEEGSISGEVTLAASQIKQESAELDQEIAEHGGRSRFKVLAPVAGHVTSLGFVAGQTVSAGTVLASLNPAGSALEAELFVPAHARGFVSPGQRVMLRVSSFPYQKFGQIDGTVLQVADAPLPTAVASTEPMFRVTVKLSQQSVTAYGREHKFTTGMTLEADILLDRRRLIEWVFDPLLSVAKEILP